MQQNPDYGGQAYKERSHGYGMRGLDQVPQSPSYEGRFGRMFRKLPVFVPEEDFLRELADGMVDEGQSGDNPAIPAGFTYLGQFIDHDITFDPASSLQRANDPDALVNFRTPRFDLDSLYGRGPADDPFMYDQGSPGGAKLVVGKAVEDDGQEIDEDDLLRTRDPHRPIEQGHPQGRAVIGDPRNDENIFVSQLQLSFIKLHNRVVEEIVAPQGFIGGELLKEAQRIVRWHYQWVVVHDYLPAVIGEDLHKKLLKEKGGRESVELSFYKPKYHPYMPVEFSVAAYRFGHSMIRDRYQINNTVPRLPLFLPEANPDRRADFRGFRPLPPLWTNSWPFFFNLDGQAPTPSRQIDTRLSKSLFGLPGEADADMKSLARRNLLRGRALGLPDGHLVALAVGAQPLTAPELGFSEPPPLWYYVLKEAEVRHQGGQLGEVGGRIVGEVLLGLLEGDPLSYINVQPDWKPEPPISQTGDLSMAELLSFAVPDQANRF